MRLGDTRGANSMWRLALALTVAALCTASSCTYSVTGDQPRPIQPSPPSFQPAVEHTVADFSFALGSGDMSISLFDGAELDNEIMESWKERGYVRSEQFVSDGAFSPSADYRLTLRGSQRGGTSFVMQCINALTLGLVPYTITQNYEFEYVLQDMRTGATHKASVKATDKTWVEPFLVFALPIHSRGHRRTMDRVGDRLYDQFWSQGLFQLPLKLPPEEDAAAVPAGNEDHGDVVPAQPAEGRD